jgi:hypothetical protein
MRRFLVAAWRSVHIGWDQILWLAAFVPWAYSVVRPPPWPGISTAWATAVAALLIGAVFLILRIMRLESEAEPSLRLAEPFVSRTNRGPPSRPRDQNLYQPVSYIHVVVESEGSKQIDNCQVRVTKVARRSGSTIVESPPGKPFPLVTAGEGHVKTTSVFPGLRQHFDVLWVNPDDGRLDFAPKIEVPYYIPPDFFDEKGTYEVHVIVIGNNTRPAPGVISVHWDGNVETVTAKRLKHFR